MSKRCASPTCRPSSMPTGLEVDVPGSASSRSTSPMAAISTPSSSRRRISRHGDQPPATAALEPGRARGLNERYTFEHPGEPGINRLRHMLWTGKPQHPEAHARNAVFYGDKAIDRSPCGTGTSARMAQWRKGRAEGRTMPSCTNRSSARCSRAGSRRKPPSRQQAGIIPSIGGWARMTGYNTIFIDDRDPKGFAFETWKIMRCNFPIAALLVDNYANKQTISDFH
jgi:4-hydroxyproline epimerase